MKMSLSRKGDFDPMKVVASAVLILLMLIILFAIIGKYFPGLLSLGDCYDRGGICRQKTIGGGCEEDEYRLYGMFAGCGKNEICCKPIKEKPSKLEEFSEKEREALYNAFIFTINNDPTPIQDREVLDLRVDTEYAFHISLNDKLKSAKKEGKIGRCAVYIKDESEAGKRYAFKGDGTLELREGNLALNKELFDCQPGKEIKIGGTKKGDVLSFKPSLLDVYKDLTLYVILFDKETDDETGRDNTEVTEEERQAMYSNTDHWVAYRAYRINVEPVVKISGMSGTWVNKDDITLSCEGVTCTGFGLKLVKLKSGNYEEMVNECKQGGFASELDYIAGTALKTTGIPLNINLGGIRLPSQQKILYRTMKKPITVVDNKASVLIDKATMISTFYGVLNTPADYFTGENTYLCVKATTEDGKEVYGLSKTPLKIDVLPPLVDPQKDIKVVYPEPFQGVLSGSSQTTPYYYKRYPRVVITSCYDYGQSGCAHYDYYIHTGRFVNLRSVTANWETGIKALLLTEGLNMLFNHLAKQDPANTICPYLYSTSYRLNTKPEIGYPYEGQGIICLRISDKAGNTELYWKEVWTPEEMFKKILAEEAEELASNITG